MTTPDDEHQTPLRILVSGPARSGTTWIGEAIAAATGSTYVDEPDHPIRDPLSWASSKGLGNYPFVAAGERRRDYELLFDVAFAGGWQWPRRPRVRNLLAQSGVVKRQVVPRAAAVHRRLWPRQPRVVVKSVFGANSVEWIAERYRPLVVLTRRNILNVVASFKSQRWNIVPGKHGLPSAEQLERLFPDATAVTPFPEPKTPAAIAWWVAAHMLAQDRLLERHPDWVLARHDDICRAPADRYAEILAALDLPWTRGIAEYLVESDTDSIGDHFTRRHTQDQPDNWRRRLTPEDVEDVRRVLEGFPRGYWEGD